MNYGLGLLTGVETVNQIKGQVLTPVQDAQTLFGAFENLGRIGSQEETLMSLIAEYVNGMRSAGCRTQR